MTRSAPATEVASGLPLDAVETRRLYEAAAQIFPDRAVPAPLDPARLASHDREAMAVMGGRHVRGLGRDASSAVVTTAGERDLVGPLETWLEDREGQLVVLERPMTLDAWYREQPVEPRTVCVVGTAISWRELAALQDAGVLIARLPFRSPGQVERWARTATLRWFKDATLRKRAWIVAPADDRFTHDLAEHTVARLCRELHQLGFAGDPLAAPAEGEPVGLVLLLAHGDERTGAPVIAERAVARVLAACGDGAVIVHLGCHGAGRSAGHRYGDLPRHLGAAVSAGSATDTCSSFALDCLVAGATGFIGHLDATWSGTFEQPRALIDLVASIAEGTATCGYAVGLLANEANRRARLAMTQRLAGNVVASGEAWLRYLDLSGFVCLGDVRAYAAWSAG